jgi:hypothetical protein
MKYTTNNGISKTFEEWDVQSKKDYEELRIPRPDDWFNRYDNLFGFSGKTHNRVTWNHEHGYNYVVRYRGTN